jgi:hypothetical protein
VPDTTIKPTATIAEPLKLTTETATHASLVAAIANLDLKPAVQLPTGFKITEVPIAAGLHLTPIGLLTPTLGPLAAFTGTFTGSGFNTIFRPDSPTTPTPLPIPVSGSDNVLELNLTSETLSFSPALGSVPNRGMVQGDAFLNGVPYLQSISDVTNPAQPTGIHLEPGLWICVPPTTDPKERQEVARMASIPHGTTVLAQGASFSVNGPPTIAPVDITPFQGATKFPFASQTATAHGSARIPQDLTSFIAAGTITQAMLTDPNTVLRNAIAGQHITHTTVITISTSPASPLFGGGAENIAFLMGDAGGAKPNARTTQMTAIFWIETVQHTILVPIFKAGDPPLTLKPQGPAPAGGVLPSFIVHPPGPIPTPRPITVTSTQIQYSQTVMLSFNGLTWPHVSVATLRPSSPIAIPPTAWT